MPQNDVGMGGAGVALDLAAASVSQPNFAANLAATAQSRPAQPPLPREAAATAAAFMPPLPPEGAEGAPPPASLETGAQKFKSLLLDKGVWCLNLFA